MSRVLETTDERPAVGITVRRVASQPTEVFVNGWRCGTYRTERGVAAAIAKHRDAAAATHARYLAAREQHRFTASHAVAGPQVVGPDGPFGVRYSTREDALAAAAALNREKFGD